MNHRDYVILQKISSELNIAKVMLGDETLDQFEEDEKTKRAICMTVINIGELVKNITEPTRMKYKEVPWKYAAGFRDIAAHKYQTLRMGDVYSTVVNDFPALLSQISDILDKEEDEHT